MCSKCGEPKKGHVCKIQSVNLICFKCGKARKDCSCEAPALISQGKYKYNTIRACYYTFIIILIHVIREFILHDCPIIKL